MSKRKYIIKSYVRKGLVIFLLLVGWLFQNEALCQTNNDTTTKIIIDPATIKLEISDSTFLSKNKKSTLLQKIIQPFKFKENRNRKQLDSIYHFMLRLVQNGELHIDSSTVYDIMFQLDTISSTNVTNTRSIDRIIAKNNLQQKASKKVIDSIKSQITEAFKIIEDNNRKSNDKPVKTKIDDNYLKEIRNVQNSIYDDSEAKDSIKVGNTWDYFYKKLATRTQVIGWHKTQTETEYLNYNYSYLSAINLFGYELASNGEVKNQRDIKTFEESGGVIEMANEKNCAVHLTVYSMRSADISSFLNNRTAQNKLISNLDTLIERNGLKGINIFFNTVGAENSKAFAKFISTLRENLTGINNTIQLNITIPAVTNRQSLTKISAYNFLKLNPLVNYYMVLTDELTSLYNNKALTFSPLQNSESYGQKTIESTVNFYGNGKIPLSKIIVILSYEGIKWPVDDFGGSVVKNRTGRKIKYNKIIDKYKNTQISGRTVVGGLDSVQVAAYLNISPLYSLKEGKNTREQVWYEDASSLLLKYNWILKNELGGVAIRDLGDDDGYSELWDVLGTTLTQIDTIYIREQSKEVCPCEYASLPHISTELKLSNRKMLWNDLLEAKNANPDSSFVTLFRNDYDLAKIANLTYTKGVSSKNKHIIESETACRNLIGRWYIYSRILFGFTILFLLFAASLTFWKNQLERFKPGGDNARFFLVIAFWLFIFLALLALLLGLFFEPSLDSIGAGNQGESNFWILVKAGGIGIVLGIILKLSMNKNKYNLKNQP